MRSARGGRWAGVAALAGYAFVSFCYFGLPVAAHPGRDVVGSDNDPKIFIWFFAWWPHAILHWQNPIYAHSIWAPHGYNLAWATSVPGLALAFAPLTLLAGPVVSYNVAAIMLPALAAWTAFLLCRYVTRSFLPSLLGGYLFGFSSYMLGHEEGHMHLAAVFLVPLVPLAILRFVRGEIGRRGLALRLGAIVAAELLISTEVLATLTLAVAVGLMLAFALVPKIRGRLRASVVPVATGYAIGAVLTAPFLYHTLTGFVSEPLEPPASKFNADAENLFVPTPTSASSTSGSVHVNLSWQGNELERGAYLGVPLVVLLCFAFVQLRKEAAGRFLLVSFLAALVAAFGAGLRWHGYRYLALPWALIQKLPVVDNVYAGRLVLYAWLAAAAAVALWAARRAAPGWLRVAMSVLVVVSLAPNLGHDRWNERFAVPPFITDKDYERCLTKGENVLALPYGYQGKSVLWQALSGFYYRLAGGQVGVVIPPGFEGSLAPELVDDSYGPDVASLLAFAKHEDVSLIMAAPHDRLPWRSILASVGAPQTVGGVLLYRLDGSAAPKTCR